MQQCFLKAFTKSLQKLLLHPHVKAFQATRPERKESDMPGSVESAHHDVRTHFSFASLYLLFLDDKTMTKWLKP